MTNTPNKGYTNQATATNSGTWGVVLNSNFTTIDNNLGGTLTLSVAGNTNVTLTAAQSQNLIYKFTGALTGNINVIFPAAGGLYFINNQTTGAFSLTVVAPSSTTSILIPQNTQVPIFIDNSTNPATVGGATGTQYVYVAPVVGGTANALTVANTLPANYSLEVGTLLTFTPSNFNTASATITDPANNTITLQKVGATGLVNLQANDLVPGVPCIATYNGSVFIILNLVYYGSPTTESGNFNLTVAGLYVPYIATAPINVTLSATTSYGPIFTCDFFAESGSITLIPNGTDNINGVNANFIIPLGDSGRLYNDGAGNWYVYFSNQGAASYAPNSVLANNSLVSAAPVAINLSSSQLVGRASTGNIRAVSLDSTLSISTASILAVATATSSQLGAVKPDGTIITNTAGAITVAKASSSAFGVVEVDNTTITASAGVISAVAVVPTALGVGSIIQAYNNTGSQISANATTAASNIKIYNLEFNVSVMTTIVNSSGDSISGTWKALQTCAAGSNPTYYGGLWQRTA